MKFFTKKRGQNAAEYALVFALVIGAAVAVQGLVKNAIHGRIVNEVTKLADDEQRGLGIFTIDSQTNTSRESFDSTDVKEGGAVDVIAEANVTRNTTEGYILGQ